VSATRPPPNPCKPAEDAVCRTSSRHWTRSSTCGAACKSLRLARFPRDRPAGACSARSWGGQSRLTLHVVRFGKRAPSRSSSSFTGWLTRWRKCGVAPQRRRSCRSPPPWRRPACCRSGRRGSPIIKQSRIVYLVVAVLSRTAGQITYSRSHAAVPKPSRGRPLWHGNVVVSYAHC
jgi:hypothetical protein